MRERSANFRFSVAQHQSAGTGGSLIDGSEFHVYQNSIMYKEMICQKTTRTNKNALRSNGCVPESATVPFTFYENGRFPAKSLTMFFAAARP